jgi:ribosome-binding factor A
VTQTTEKDPVLLTLAGSGVGPGTGPTGVLDDAPHQEVLMADPARARKLAVRIRQIVSAAIETQIKDPRLGMVTVTDARVTNDLREATVFYTVFGDATQVADSAKALASATGVLRSTVGRQTGIKFVPTLAFVADAVPDNARELDEAIERVRHADAELARAREGASYAGEPDPYRRPAESGDDDETADESVEDTANALGRAVPADPWSRS